MNFSNQENTIQLLTDFVTNIFKNKLLVNTILLFWFGVCSIICIFCFLYEDY